MKNETAVNAASKLGTDYEQRSGFYVLQVSVELPYMLVQVLIFSWIVYPMIGFELAAGKFLWFFLYLVMSFMYYTLYGMMTVALTPNIEIAMGLSFLIFIFWNVFSGFIIAREVPLPEEGEWFGGADDAGVVAVGVLGGPGGVDGVRAHVLAAGGPDGADPGAGGRGADGARVPGGVPGPAGQPLRAGDLPPPRHHRPLRLALLPRHQAPQLPAQVEGGGGGGFAINRRRH